MSILRDTIVWDDSLLLGIPLLDEQHKSMVNISNELFAACIESPENANSHFIKSVYNAIADIHRHFSKEEKLMSMLFYQGTVRHKREHTNFFFNVVKQLRAHETGKKIVPEQFVYFFKDWLLSHITVSDRVLATHIKEMNRTGKLKQIFETKQEKALLSA